MGHSNQTRSISQWLVNQAMHPRLKIVRFLAAGLPSFALAVPANWLLVVRAGVAPPLAYALVLLLQVTMNFFMCRWFVFRSRRETPIYTQYAHFVTGILAFRVADWALYALLVSVCGLYFLAVQVFNIFLFAFLKYRFSQRVMEASP